MYFVILLMLLVSHGINTQDSPIPPDILVKGDNYVNFSRTTPSRQNNEPLTLNRSSNSFYLKFGTGTPWPANFSQTTASSEANQPKIVNRIRVAAQIDLNPNTASSKTPWPFHAQGNNNLNRLASTEVPDTDSTTKSTTEHNKRNECDDDDDDSESDESEERTTTEATTTTPTRRTTTYKTTTRSRRKIRIKIITTSTTTTPTTTKKKKKKNKFLGFLRGVKTFFVGSNSVPVNPLFVQPSIGLVRPSSIRFAPPRRVFLPIRG